MGTLATGAPQLKQGRMVPLFTLPAAGGGTSGPGALRSKYNMVLAFLDMEEAEEEGARAYLGALSEAYSGILDEQARVIAVVITGLEAAETLSRVAALPFTLLADAGGAVTQRMLGEARAGLCVADRYGEAFYVEVAPTAAQLPPPQAAIDWLQFIGIQCPE
jgi:peroxiredoxin